MRCPYPGGHLQTGNRPFGPARPNSLFRRPSLIPATPPTGKHWPNSFLVKTNGQAPGPLTSTISPWPGVATRSRASPLSRPIHVSAPRTAASSPHRSAYLPPRENQAQVSLRWSGRQGQAATTAHPAVVTRQVGARLQLAPAGTGAPAPSPPASARKRTRLSRVWAGTATARGSSSQAPGRFQVLRFRPAADAAGPGSRQLPPLHRHQSPA